MYIKIYLILNFFSPYLLSALTTSLNIGAAVPPPSSSGTPCILHVQYY